VFGCMHPGCIHEDELGIRQGQDAKLAAAGGLRTRRNGRDLLTE